MVDVLPKHLTLSLARPSTPDTTTRISVTVPASDVEQDIQILLTPKKSTRYAEPPTLQGSSVAAMVPPLELQKSRNPEQPESFAVPLEYLQRWPPSLPRGPGSFGWTWRNWYVVKKGRHPGIYMDFWYAAS